MSLLSEYAFFSNGKKRPKEEGIYPVYGGNGILGYANDYNMENGVIIGRVGAYCGSVYLEKGKCWVSDNAIKAETTEKSNLVYLYYLLKGLHLNERQIGTSQPLLTQGILNNIDVSVPEISVQNRIADILESLDEKMHINTEINQNLSEQIQTIYDELIDKIEAAPIEISSVIDVRDGTHDSPKAQETGLPLVTSKHLLPYGVDLSSPNRISKDDYEKINERSRVDTFDILLSMIGTVGIISLVVDSPVEFAIKNVGLFKSSATPELYPFVLAYLRSKSTMQHIERVLAGSTQKYVSLGELRKLPIALPNSQQLIDFNAVVKPIIEQIIILTRENKQLTVLRDSLLPKLMSGELDVSEIEI